MQYCVRIVLFCCLYPERIIFSSTGNRIPSVLHCTEGIPAYVISYLIGYPYLRIQCGACVYGEKFRFQPLPEKLRFRFMPGAAFVLDEIML